jgi:hypothetical protein
MQLADVVALDQGWVAVILAAIAYLIVLIGWGIKVEKRLSEIQIEQKDMKEKSTLRDTKIDAALSQMQNMSVAQARMDANIEHIRAAITELATEIRQRHQA